MVWPCTPTDRGQGGRKLCNWKPKSRRLAGRPKSEMRKPYKRGFMNYEYKYLQKMDPESGYRKAETFSDVAPVEEEEEEEEEEGGGGGGVELGQMGSFLK